MPSSFTLVTRAKAPLETLFDLSLSIDEHVASMDRSGERAVDGVTSGSIGLGETVTWRARHFGIWFTMTSQITSLERPDRFVDEQIRGPFRSFHHEHSFHRDGGRTVMTDTVTIESPVFRRLPEHIILVPYLRRLIRSRNHHLLAQLNAAPGTEPHLSTWPADDSSIFRRFEATAPIGHGDKAWERATRDVLRWGVKTRSGFIIDDAHEVSPGEEQTIIARFAGVSVREPVQVVAVIQTAERVGFAYRTLPGHPVTGEEAFIVQRHGDDVHFTIRSLTAPAAAQPWRALYPLLRIAQAIVRLRYLRALR